MSGLLHVAAAWKAITGGSFLHTRDGARRAITLMYHEVLPDKVNIPCWLVVKQSAFEKQMRWLKRHFNVVDLDTAANLLENGTRAHSNEKPLAIVTFDDGYAGNLSCVLPIMRSLQLPFTVYIATRATMDGRRYWYDDIACALMDSGRRTQEINSSQGTITFEHGTDGNSRRWDRINQILTSFKRLPVEERELAAKALGGCCAFPEYRMLKAEEVSRMAGDSLVSIGNHTHTHDLLNQLNDEEARLSIVRAQEILRNLTGVAPVHFSYPNGNRTCDLDRLVEELGFRTAVGTTFGAWLSKTSRYNIPRLSVGRFDSLWKFRFRALLAVFAAAS